MALPEHIELEIVTPEREVLHETVESVQIPGKDGYLGVLPGHAPLLTELGVGELSFLKGSATENLTVIGGIAEVLPSRVIVLAEISERAGEIDVGRAQSARDRAQSKLSKPGTELDWGAESFAYEKALIRLHVAARKTGYSGKE
jgi:F-type H+-transporting ATPase subunit epsilon